VLAQSDGGLIQAGCKQSVMGEGAVWRRAAILVALLLPLCCLLASCTDPSSKLPNYGPVPKFSMTDSLGHPFDGSVLVGKVWVADFIYTSCPGPCPRMTSQMHGLQKQLAADQDVRLVSISVDPANDTPAVLNAFANRFGGPAEDWVFLTGTPATVHLLAHDVFKVGDIIQSMDHSTKFMVVDKRGNLRGYYSSDDDAESGIPALLKDVESLRHQRS
jgi:protein SCO1/2